MDINLPDYVSISVRLGELYGLQYADLLQKPFEVNHGDQQYFDFRKYANSTWQRWCQDLPWRSRVQLLVLERN
jgi:hypothetical protein